MKKNSQIGSANKRTESSKMPKVGRGRWIRETVLHLWKLWLKAALKQVHFWVFPPLLISFIEHQKTWKLHRKSMHPREHLLGYLLCFLWEALCKGGDSNLREFQGIPPPKGPLLSVTEHLSHMGKKWHTLCNSNQPCTMYTENCKILIM